MDFADHDRQRPKLNIAPLIDVVFLLLIFFMLAGSFVERTAIDLSIPSNQAPTSATAEPLVVDVGLSGRFRADICVKNISRRVFFSPPAHQD